MKIQLQQFAGMVPKTQARYLPDSYAVSAVGADLTGGDLVPMRASTAITTLPAVADRIYLNGADWISWAVDADAVPGAVATDRLYVTTANTEPRLIYSGGTYPLALPAPTLPPTATNLTEADPEAIETVLYAFTWVTDLGEESAPSPLSGELEWSQDVPVRLSNMQVPPLGRLIASKRIYRSQTSATGATDLFFVAEITGTDTGFDHYITQAPLQEAIGTKDFDTPPPSMRGLVSLPNGMMAAFDGKEVLFCEPYMPHAWPGKYALQVNDKIVGLAAFGSSLAILTTGTPYVAQGYHPESMTMTRIEQSYPCLAKRGIVDMGYAAVYPSTNGLVQITSNGAQMLSGNLWNRKQWLDLAPETFRAAAFGGRYVTSHMPLGALKRILTFVDVSGQTPFLINSGQEAKDLYEHLETGRLIVLASDGRTILSYDDTSASPGSYVWESKPFAFPFPTGFGAVRIDANAVSDPDTWMNQAATDGILPSLILDFGRQQHASDLNAWLHDYLSADTRPAGSGSISASIYRDGELVRTISTLNQIERLPSGEGLVWSIRLEGSANVTGVILAGSPDEILGG